MNNLIINIIITIFPILIYFIHSCLKQVNKEDNNMMLNISLITSLYLYIKLVNPINISSLLMCDISILISYLEDKKNIATLLSITIILFIYLNIKNLLIIYIIKYILLYVLYIISKKIKSNKSNLLAAQIIIISFITGLITFYYIKSNLITLIISILYISLIIIIILLLVNLFELSKKITNLYKTEKELIKEKQLKNSLFKITHEVKNPIAVCKGYLEMINTEKNEQLKKYIPIIKEELNRSLNIMNDFMEFNKIKINKEIIDINYLIEEVEDEIRIITSKKNININTHVLQEETYINADYSRLKQVLANILKNSIESINDKGEISIITHILKSMYYIEIKDTGCGMNEETLKHVKEMFYTTKKQGNGLGIALSNEIIEAHGGTLEYTSKENKGTTAIIKLPLDRNTIKA